MLQDWGKNEIQSKKNSDCIFGTDFVPKHTFGTKIVQKSTLVLFLAVVAENLDFWLVPKKFG